MAISAQYLIDLIDNPDFSVLEQLLIDYLEGFYDKELLLRYNGSFVEFNRFAEFEAPLKAANINLGRYTRILDEIIAIYDVAGWTVTYVVTPAASVIRFTPKTS